MKTLNIKNNFEFKLPINIFAFKPCFEYQYWKLKLFGNFEAVQSIYNELLRCGIANEELAPLLTTIERLTKKGLKKEKIVLILQRFINTKRRKK